MTSVRDFSRIITKARTRDEEQIGKVQRDGQEPARQRLLRELRRRRAQVRRQQSLEGLSDRGAFEITMSTIFRPYFVVGPSAATAAPATACATGKKSAKSIRENIADIIAEESIIGKDRDRIIKVPIRGIKEYRFVYGDNAPGVGQGGTANPSPARVVGQGERRQGADNRRATGPASTTTRPTSRSKS